MHVHNSWHSIATGFDSTQMQQLHAITQSCEGRAIPEQPHAWRRPDPPKVTHTWHRLRRQVCCWLQGFLYVLDCEGKTLPGWPLQMGDIQAQVAVGDINGDGQLELIGADARGNVAAFTAKAEELWERHVGSLVSQVSAASLLWQQACFGMDDVCLYIRGMICASSSNCALRMQQRAHVPPKVLCDSRICVLLDWRPAVKNLAGMPQVLQWLLVYFSCPLIKIGTCPC